MSAWRGGGGAGRRSSHRDAHPGKQSQGHCNDQRTHPRHPILLTPSQTSTPCQQRKPSRAGPRRSSASGRCVGQSARACEAATASRSARSLSALCAAPRQSRGRAPNASAPPRDARARTERLDQVAVLDRSAACRPPAAPLPPRHPQGHRLEQQQRIRHHAGMAPGGQPSEPFDGGRELHAVVRRVRRRTLSSTASPPPGGTTIAAQPPGPGFRGTPRPSTQAPRPDAPQLVSRPSPAMLPRGAALDLHPIGRLSAWSRTWSGPRRRETSGSPPGSGSPSCPGP